MSVINACKWGGCNGTGIPGGPCSHCGQTVPALGKIDEPVVDTSATHQRVDPGEVAAALGE